MDINLRNLFFTASRDSSVGDTNGRGRDDRGHFQEAAKTALLATSKYKIYGGWNFNSGNYLFTTDTK